MATLAEQLERFVGTWEPSLARDFFHYDRRLRAKARRPLSAWDQKEIKPYWKELPRWLSERSGDGRDALSPGFLDTVLWGQTSLFYAVRIQDDLLDGNLSRTPLVLAPLLFLSEADRALASVIESDAAFWEHYRLALQTTLAGITRVAEMQRTTAAGADELLQSYGGVDAIFSVGSSAVCDRMGTGEEIPHVEEFVSELGKVLLALDDLEDIEEDLLDGRLNYPARILLGGRVGSETDLSHLAKSWRQHVSSGGYDEIRLVLLGCLSRAAEAIAPLELQPAMDLIETTRGAVQNLRKSAPTPSRFISS